MFKNHDPHKVLTVVFSMAEFAFVALKKGTNRNYDTKKSGEHEFLQVYRKDSSGTI